MVTVDIDVWNSLLWPTVVGLIVTGIGGIVGRWFREQWKHRARSSSEEKLKYQFRKDQLENILKTQFDIDRLNQSVQEMENRLTFLEGSVSAHAHCIERIESERRAHEEQAEKDRDKLNRIAEGQARMEGRLEGGAPIR